MSSRRRRDWREICEDVLKETSPDRTNLLLEELLQVLEERAERRGPGREQAAKPS
jgi:hypothetical protein